jgi:signal transduction histidine kinase
MNGLLEKINSKILLKITLLVIVEITLIVGSFSVLIYFQIQTDKNSQNLIRLQTIFGILIIGILILILYLVARMLKPIFYLTQATYKIKKGNFDVTIRQKGSDELSVLTEFFNSMTASIKGYMKDQHELTEKLELANEELNVKDKTKNEFINMAAHELRAPVQPILGMAEILRRRKSDGEKNNNNTNTSAKEDIEYLDIIIRNAKRLLRLEQNILDITKIESKTLKLDKERFNLIEKITNVINDFGGELSKEKIELVFTPKSKSQPEPIFVNADKVRIFEVISNLLGNAIKFTAKSDKRRIIINAEKRDSEAVVHIKDTGPGIKPEVLPKLFSKFVTNSPGGTGVGLFISKSIVEAHGGKIWAENNTCVNGNANGKGATFSFSLPLTN